MPSVIDLERQCVSRGIEMVLSKPLPLCLFPESSQGELVRRLSFVPLCGVFEDGFTRNVCLLPDGTFSPCLGMLESSTGAQPARTWSDLSAFCTPRVREALDHPLLVECQDCFLHARRLCQGACIAHKTGSDSCRS